MNRVAIVVLNWNGYEDTIACLGSLAEQTYSDCKIVVIDNGSVDESVGVLQDYVTKHPGVELILNKKNLGFAGGVNTGIKWAQNNKFDFVALFNNDALADKDWLKYLIKAFDKEDIGIATGLLLHEDGKTIDSSGDWYSKWGLPFPRNRNENVVFAPDDGLVFGASGGATLYKIAVFKDVGHFDEDFFAYYEDVDISFRAQLAGWKIAYVSSAIAYHKQGATSNKLPGFTVYQTFKNLPWLYIKNVPSKLLLSISVRFFIAYGLIFLNAITHGNAAPALKGLFKSLILTPKKIHERYIIQKRKSVSSEYIKSILWDDLPPDQTGIRKLRKKITGK